MFPTLNKLFFAQENYNTNFKKYFFLLEDIYKINSHYIQWAVTKYFANDFET